MTSNLNLEETLRAKLEREEISQEEFDNLMKKFGDLDLLGSTIPTDRSHREHRRHSSRSEKSWVVHGSATNEGGDISEDVRVNGRLTVNGDLKCPTMKISGSTGIRGDLTVVDGFRLSGSMTVEGVGKFGGPTKISGKLRIDENAYFTETLKLSGKAEFGKEVVIGDYFKISGKLEAGSIQSKSTVKLSGVMYVQDDVVAKEFISSGGKSEIGGNLQAELVEIAKKYRERYTDDEGPMGTDEIDSLPDLGRFISNIVTKVLPGILGRGGTWGTPSTFYVTGNLIATNADVSYIHVKGDIEADDIIIGPEVKVDGVIRYRNSIEVPENHELTIEKI